jgi:hypothetical protein
MPADNIRLAGSQPSTAAGQPWSGPARVRPRWRSYCYRRLDRACYAVIQAPEAGSTAGRTSLLAVAALALLVLFGLVEKRSAAPLVPLRSFRSRALIGGNLITLAFGMGAFGLSFAYTQYAHWRSAIPHSLAGQRRRAGLRRVVAHWALTVDGYRGITTGTSAGRPAIRSRSRWSRCSWETTTRSTSCSSDGSRCELSGKGNHDPRKPRPATATGRRACGRRAPRYEARYAPTR